MIKQEIIERALALTGKTMEDMWEIVRKSDCECKYAHFSDYDFSYQKFFYYLISTEFIEKYEPLYHKYHIEWWYIWDNPLPKKFLTAIYKYQKWSPEYLILLLAKI